MSQKCKILGKGGKCHVCIPKNMGCKYDKKCVNMFARDLLLSCHKSAAYTECKYGGSLGRPGSSCAKARLVRPR